ncbi:hypothetical protein FOA52_000853 [Chlamydomonas sp. UWO 241]|nr:hypothetical protein FOA52_000853 [Chlamydomonas sp. UWO 241]
MTLSIPTALMFEGWHLQLADLRGLEKLSQLEELHIKRSTNFPTGLHCLSSLSNLRSITLEEIDYPGTIPQEFVGLSRLTKLEVVRFVTVGPLADEIVALAQLTRLKTLEISQHYDESLIPALYALMTSVSSLETLTIPQFELTDGLVRHLVLQPKLTTLVVGRWRLTYRALSGGGDGADASVPVPLPPPPLPHVRSLSLRCHDNIVHAAEVPAAVPLIVDVLPGLENLNLCMIFLAAFRPIYTDEALERTAALLSQACANMTDGDCGVIAGALPPSVCDVRLDDCPRLGDAGMLALACGLPGLRSLTLCLATEVTARGVIRLVYAAPRLTALTLDMCAPVTAAQCARIMQRFIAAGRPELTIECTHAARE